MKTKDILIFSIILLLIGIPSLVGGWKAGFGAIIIVSFSLFITALIRGDSNDY